MSINTTGVLDWDIMENEILTKTIGYIQQDYGLREILISVSRGFKEFIYTHFDPMISRIMNTPLEIKVQIGYFVDDRGQDNVEYLVGPIKILQQDMDTEMAEKELNNNTIGTDCYGSKRSYEPVILMDIYMGSIFGSGILMKVEQTYQTQTAYCRNGDNELMDREVENPNPNPPQKQYSDIYWLYILELDGNYFTTFTYVILPYYDINININIKYFDTNRVIKVYQLIPDIEIDLPDLDIKYLERP